MCVCSAPKFLSHVTVGQKTWRNYSTFLCSICLKAVLSLQKCISFITVTQQVTNILFPPFCVADGWHGAGGMSVLSV